MRIGVSCLAAPGGSGAVATAVARGLALRGHEVRLVASEQPFRWAPTPGLSFHRVEIPPAPALPNPPWEYSLAAALVDVSQVVDVIHVHYAVPHLAAALLAAESRCPVVATLHGTDVTRVGSHPAVLPFTRSLLTRCAALSTPSAHLAKVAQRLFALPETPRALPNFIDPEALRPPATPQRAVFDPLFSSALSGLATLVHVSNCRPVKRVTDAIRVVGALPEARLVVIGEGPDRAAAEREAEALGASDRVAWVGAEWLPRFGHADAYLNPSEEESFGLAALEAMAVGLPVVGTRVPGFDEVVLHGVTGSLHPVGDAAGMAAGVREVLGRPELRAAARHRAVSGFSADAVLPEVEAWLASAVASWIPEGKEARRRS